MKPKLTLFISTVSMLLLTLQGFPQDSIEVESHDPLRYNKVLIIPFDPGNYFSDADENIASFSKKNPKEVHAIFRKNLDYAINQKVGRNYKTTQILRDTTSGGKVDLKSVYKAISYREQVPTPILNKTDDKKKKAFLAQIEERIKDKFKEDKIEQTEAEKKAVHLIEKENNTNRKYMDAEVHSQEMLDYFNNKYGTDLFLFINQFEIKTDAENCLDRAALIYARKIKVHFSIYDDTGKHLYGDVVTTLFPSSTNNIAEIIFKNFSIIAEYIADKLPEPVQEQK